MLQIPCPFCGPRDEEEFRCGGQSHVARPANTASDTEWADYLYDQRNPKGIHLERWCHTFGCRQWFNVARHTVTHRIAHIYRMGEAAPSGLSA